METMKTTQQEIQQETPEIVLLGQSQLANTLVNRFNGFIALDQEKQGKMGALFARIQTHTPVKMRKFHRTAKTADGKKVLNPYHERVFTVSDITVTFNALWQNKVDNVRDRTDGTDTGWEANAYRNNGIENYMDSRVVCFHPVHGRFYLNYIVLKYNSPVHYVDEKGNTVNFSDIEEYVQDRTESREREAKKHGVSVENDPQIRQVKFDNLIFLRIFGKEYRIPENTRV